MAAKKLQARQSASLQTASESSTSYKQPTTTIGLSTTFTPAASCASNKLTMLPPPGYLIWANEPVPFPETTVTNCYPEEFLRGYTSVSSSIVASSIVPVMSPLVCPSNFCTQYVAEDNYIACCPSEYSFQPPLTPKVRDRPGYGGTCISEFSLSSTVTVLQYAAGGATNMAPFAATTTGAHAYAHPIDGFAPSAPKLGCAVPLSSLASSGSSSLSFWSLSSSSINTSVPTIAASSNSSTSTSPGTIAGAVVGSLVGLAAIVGLVFFLLRRRNAQRSEPTPEIHQLDGEYAEPPAEKSADVAANELGNSDRYEQRGFGPGEQVFELNAQPVHEMSAWPSDSKDKP